MFKDSRVQELDLSGFKMRADANLSQMFSYMYSLNKVYVSENWSDIVKTDCLPFWACTGLTGSQTSQQEGLDMANYDTGYLHSNRWRRNSMKRLLLGIMLLGVLASPLKADASSPKFRLSYWW